MNSKHPQITEGVGVMSGTSLDGLDLAHCRFEANSEGQVLWKIVCAETIPLPDSWKKRLSQLPESNAATFARTDVELGHFIGEQVAKFVQGHQLSPEFVASHGQTVFHQPDQGFTSQIGDGETLGSHLSCPVVSNFRNKDVALGGQGAPLVPCAERALFPEIDLFLNLGGIANISIGDSAFDVCVCNMALNWLASRSEPSLDYDANGQMAEKGAVSQDLLEGLESIEWYQTSPPRSLGAEWFEEQLLPILNDPSLSIEDRLATYCRHIALRVRDSLKSSQTAGEILITGGGANNLYLFNELKHEFASIGVLVQVEVDCQVIDFKEALSFAYLGWLTLQGKCNTMPSVTGARRAAVSGSIHLPSGGGFHLSQNLA